MNAHPDLTTTIGDFLRKNGFSIHANLELSNVHFDLVAEDSQKLVFFELHKSNSGWLDGFYDRQAVLSSLTQELDLGRKRRDVYLVEITTDPIDTPMEQKAAEEIQSNTSAARKIVVDASGISEGGADAKELEEILTPILSGVKLKAPASDMDVLETLQRKLAAKGFGEGLAKRLIADFRSDDHDCLLIIQEEEHAT